MSLALLCGFAVLLALLDAPGPVAFAQGSCEPSPTGACPPGDKAGAAPPARAAPSGADIVLFWGIGCSHCERAQAFLTRLEQATPGLSVERVEVRQSTAGRERFMAEARRLGIDSPAIPLFVIGSRYVVGYLGEPTEREIIGLARPPSTRKPEPPRDEIVLPYFGAVDADRISLPVLAIVVGLLDGLNPCAAYVLIALLGILAHVRSQRRMAVFGATFVVMSGVVYFAFMTAWLNAFLFVGVSRWLTRGLGVVLAVMGFVNLKEILWFQRGPSLMIPERAKPGLFRRMRAIAQAASGPAAFVGIASLAFVVNLVELGCTLGLPAMFTHVLSSRGTLGGPARYAYLAIYNVAYIVPLALLVVVYIASSRRIRLTERHAKVLKGVSGTLLLTFGLLFAIAPDVLD